MRTFAEKPKATQQATSPKTTVPAWSHLGHNHEVNSILHLQRTIGNQAVQRLLQSNAEERNTILTGTTSPQFGHDFSRILIYPPAVGVIQTKLAINTPGDEYEQEADRIADQVLQQKMPQEQKVDIQAKVSNQPTEGEHQVNENFNPGSLEGKRLLAHELTHVVQQSPYNAIGSHIAHKIAKQTILRTTLSSIPLQQRLALQIRTQRPMLTSQEIQQFFHQTSSGAWDMTNPSPGGASVQLGPDVSPVLQTPLTTVAEHLNGVTVTQDGQTAPLLGPNTVVTVSMDLTSYGGAAGLYRYTLYNVPASGQGGNLLIESLSPIGGPPGGPLQQATYTQSTGQAAGTISAGGQTFHLLGDLWTPPRIASVREAFSLMPASVLSRAAGLRISIQSGGLGTGLGSQDEGGHYDPPTDTVTLYRAIWGQMSGPGAGQQMQDQNPVQAIAHEIAHAIDRRVLQQAERTYQQSAGTQADLSALLAARGLSGGRYTVSDGSYGFSDVLTATQGNAFRQAYIQDGASIAGGRIQHAVTMYGAQEWQEVYAEVFSLYITDPEALSQVRPHLYQYFASQFLR